MGCDNELISSMINRDLIHEQRETIATVQQERVRLEHRVSELNKIIANLEEFRASSFRTLESERRDLNRAQKEIIRIHKLAKDVGLVFEE